MKTVIEMAREAGLQLNAYAEAYPNIAKQLERFAALVREDEREKIALAHKIRPRGKSVAPQMIAAVLAEREKQQEPVAKVIRNETGQIAMQKPDGSYFDISKHIGQNFYTTPPTAALAASQMRDAAVKVCREHIGYMAEMIAEAIAALPIPGEEK